MSGACSIDGCPRPRRSRGLCQTHYSRWQRHGDTVGKYPRENEEARFWLRVRRTADCWVWEPAEERAVYGKFRRNDGVQVGAHRYSYQLHHGPIAAGIHICHRCDYPPCVNPDHLFAGTRLENMHDMISKGRARPGGRLFTPEVTR